MTSFTLISAGIILSYLTNMFDKIMAGHTSAERFEPRGFGTIGSGSDLSFYSR